MPTCPACTPLRDALALVLLFHRGGPWSAESRAEWFRITGSHDATTRVMCDTVRAALADAAGPGEG